MRRLTGIRPVLGNTLVEYVLPCFMIGVGLFIAVSQVASLMPTGINAGLSSDGSIPTGGKIAVQRLGDTSRIIDPEQVNVILSDGTVLKFKDYPRNLRQYIEVVGSDGTTEMIVANLRLLMAQLKDAEKIDEVQFNKLSALADQGHRLAEILKTLKQAAQSANGNKTAYDQAMPMFEGRPTTVPWLTQALGGPSPLSLECNCGNGSISLVSQETLAYFGWSSAGNPSIGPEMAAFLNAYQGALDSGALKDPAIETIVHQLTLDIRDLSTNTGTSSWNAYHPDGKSNPASLEKTTADQYAHGDSSNICSTGGGQDTGTYCPPEKDVPLAGP